MPVGVRLEFTAEGPFEVRYRAGALGTVDPLREGTTAGIDWAVIGPFTGTAILGVRDGKRLAAKVTGTLPQRTFAVVLPAVAAFMLIDALT
ncbi:MULTISPECIES: hypothetical protein [unclassified Streptomyces]|uniref:hypothetical protein n=1 Tax=unclassified Streptomyces TaxID=2593676 RepID=UPI002DD9CC95|nr:hypothetical protein [Streptomyces sp. NBC_01795]WSS39719.1 hypothetical protein OG220_03250 [Streptomyces sp. NBC_01187]